MDGIVLRIVNSQRLEYFSPWSIAVRRPRAVAMCESIDARLARSLALNREKFDVKNERGIDANHRTGTPLAVGQIRRNEKLPFGADRHELKRFGPPRDYLTDRKCCRLAALIRTIKFGAVDQSASVVAHDRVGGRGFWTRPRCHNLVLKTARKRNNSLFRFVGCQKRVALLFVRFAGRLHGFFLLLA